MDKKEFTRQMLQCPIFKDLDEEEMYKILQFAKMKTFRAGETVLEEAAITDVFFIVESGRLEAYISSATQKSGIFIREIKAGELCGEMALLGIEKRTATIRCKDDCRLIVWNAVDCLDYFRKNRSPGYLVMKNLSEILGSRVRDMNLLLRNYADALGPTAVKYL